MKKIFTSLMLMLFAVLTVNAQADVFTSNVEFTAGEKSYLTDIININGEAYPCVKIGTSKAGGNVKATLPAGTKDFSFHAIGWSKSEKTPFTVTGAGLDETLEAGTGNISGNSPYTFDVDGGYDPEAPFFTYTFETALAEQTEVTFAADYRVVFYGVNVEVETPAAGWDGETVTSSLDGVTLKSWRDVEGLTIKFPGASSIVVDEEASFNGGSTWYGDDQVTFYWSPVYNDMFGTNCAYTVNGDEITLTGWFSEDDIEAEAKPALKKAKKIGVAEDDTDRQINIFGGGFIIDGNSDWALGAYGDQLDFYFNVAEPTVVEPFMLTSVSNNDVLGNVVGVEASEQGVRYQFEVTATGKALSKGTATPTLSLLEDATVDFGAANIIAYEAETAYVRFMTLQQEYFTQPGTYVLDIPEGTFVDAEGTPNAAVTAKWVIIQGNDPEPFAITGATFGGQEAGAEVEALSYMATITAENAIVALNEGNITLTDADNQPVGGNAYVYGYEGEGGANTVYARFTFDTEDHQLHTPGVYTLNVPAGMFKDAEGNLSEAYTASWTVVAPETQTINIETVEVGTVVDDSWGTNDVYYTATVKFAKPEGAVYAYSEGLHMELNGENTGVPFQFGQYGMIQLEEGDEVTLVYKDAMIASTDDAEYEGDIRPAGSYVAETTITFLDADQLELPVTAHFVGSIVLPNLNAVELGTPEFNVAAAAEAGVEITEGWVEANGIAMTLADAKNITPDMTINVVADLLVTVPGYGAPDGEDGGFNMPQFEAVIENAEFTGDAAFGVPTVAMPEFAQYVVEAGAGNAFQIVVKSIEVISNNGVEASWTLDEEAEPVGCAFEVVEGTPAAEVVLGDAVINVDGMELSATDVEANGIFVTFPDAENVDETTEITICADLMTTVPGYGVGGDEVDGGFGAPQFQAVIEDAYFTGSVDFETGVAMVAMPDFVQYISEAGAGLYMINIKAIAVNGVDVYTCEDETAEPIGAMFAVTETFEVEATAQVFQTEANEYGDQHYQVVVTVENSDNEISAAGVAYAYTEGVVFYDESTFGEFTFNCDAQEGVQVNEDEDVVLVCTDAMVSKTTDADFEGEIRAEGTYPAYCIVVLVDADFNEVGSARFNGSLELKKNLATGITTAKFNVTDVTYNISGQRVNANAKGIVIKNGKKYVVK